MSDQEEKPQDQNADLAANAPAEIEEKAPPEPSAESAPKAAPVAGRSEAKGRRSSPIAWVALILVLALGAAAGWFLQELQRREASLNSRLAELEGASGLEQDALDKLASQMEQRLQRGLQDIGGENRDQGQLIEGQGRQLQDLQAKMQELRAEFARYSANDRDSWLLAEAEYLLRLANQRLVMAGDAVSARALLQSADNILRELDDPALHTVRGALAADLAAVRAVPSVDVEGIYLALAALIEQADRLVIFEMPDAEPRVEEEAAADWRDRLRQGYQAALIKLSDYVAIRRRDVPMQTLMDPQWEGLVRQNLRMLLEQAQVALLSGNQALYAESLARANHWVAEFFESDEMNARAMAAEIDRLAGRVIAVDMPDLARSLDALDDVMAERLKRSAEG